MKKLSLVLTAIALMGSGGVTINGLRSSVVVAPATPTITGPAGSTQWCYKATPIAGDPANPGAFTQNEGLPSAAGCLSGVSTLDSSHVNTISIPFVAGAVAYNVYRTTASGTPNSTGKIGTVTYPTQSGSATFTDNGITASGSVPTLDASNAIGYSNSDMVPTLTYVWSNGTTSAAPTNIMAVEQGTCTLGTDCATIATHFSSTTGEVCICQDATSAAACKSNIIAKNSVTFTGTGTDVLLFVCVGQK